MERKGIIPIVFLVFAGLYVISTYNSLVDKYESTEASWAQVENVYQRRADLIPNLVNIVKGYAKHEKESLQSLVDARAKATQTQIDFKNMNQEQLAMFEQSQAQVGSALSRLLAVVENYPDLKASNNFMALQTQLEGTENRITNERRLFNKTIKVYNSTIKKFPTNIFANIFSYEQKPYFEIEKGLEKAAPINF